MVSILSAGRSRRDWQETARKAEALGYSTLSVADHLWTGLAPFASLMAAAEATTTLRIGSLVFGNDFRQPVALAKEVATLDVLSEGRVEFGFGTGWERGDYAGLGTALDPVGVKVSRFEEAVRLVKAIFGDEPVNFAGKYYSVGDYASRPKPVQRPHPPLLIGGGGRRMLSIAAREADIVSFNPRTTASGELVPSSNSNADTDQGLAWVREAAGDRFAQLEFNVLVLCVVVTNDRRAGAEAQLRAWGRPSDTATVDQMLDSPQFLVGSETEMVETLQMRRERFGISYPTIFGEQNLEPFAPVLARLAGT